MISTCQIPNWKFFNAFLSELKLLLNKVSHSRSSFSDRVTVWILISLPNNQFLQNKYGIKKFESSSLCTNGNFCILLAFLRCTIETESFLKISFWVETSNVSDSELNDFQRVKFKNTISKIPRILDWVFYNVPDFELNFFREKIFLGKNNGWKSITFWVIFSRKRQNFCFLFAFLKCKLVTNFFNFQSSFKLKQSQRVRFCFQILNRSDFASRFLERATLWIDIFSEKIRTWKLLWSKKLRFDSFSPVKTTNYSFCLRF